MNTITTKALNKRFCLDRKIPLKIYEGDIFIDRIKLFGEYDNYINYCHALETFNNEQDYLTYYNSIKDTAINFIKNSEAFKALNNDDMQKYKIGYIIPTSDVYQKSNIGKTFISIDMNKANFSSLVYYGKKENLQFFDSFKYEEFMKQFTDIDHIIHSKYIRQVIFGNCNPKRQVAYEKYIMSLLLNTLFLTNVISENDVKSLCSDEIVIKADDVNECEFNKIKSIVNVFSKNIVPLKLEYYQLGKVTESSAYVKKIYGNSKSEYTYNLKCVAPDEAAFVYRTILGEKYKDEDSIFVYNEKLAKFIQSPEMKICWE